MKDKIVYVNFTGRLAKEIARRSSKAGLETSCQFWVKLYLNKLWKLHIPIGKLNYKRSKNDKN